jgi:peptide/nickel transport system permease protein
MGISYFHRRPAADVIAERITPTLILGAVAWTLSLVGGVVAGVIAARYRGGWLDRLISTSVIGLMSTPPFWLALMLIVVFAAWLGVLPSAGLVSLGREDDLGDKVKHLVLPMLALGLPHLASLAIYTRATVIEVTGEDFVRTARAKGLADPSVWWRHILRNASIPVATVAGLHLAHLLEGSLVIEAVFAWPGIGHLALTSAGRRDYPVLLLLAMVAGCIVIASNLITDLMYRKLDPRLEYA